MVLIFKGYILGLSNYYCVCVGTSSVLFHWRHALGNNILLVILFKCVTSRIYLNYFTPRVATLHQLSLTVQRHGVFDWAGRANVEILFIKTRR